MGNWLSPYEASYGIVQFPMQHGELVTVGEAPSVAEIRLKLLGVTQVTAITLR